MKSLRNRNDNNTSINKVTFARGFTEDELKLFYDLIAFTLKYEEVFFYDDIDDEVLNLIDRVIDEKINRELRDRFPVLVDAKNNIIWLPSLKKSQFCKDKSEKYDIIIKCEAR